MTPKFTETIEDTTNKKASKSGSTINFGTGDETVYGTGNAELFVLEPGDGKNVLYNIGGEDTISISGTISEYYGIDNENVRLRIEGSTEEILVKNGVGKTLTIADNNGVRQKVFSDYLTSQRQVIQNFMAALDKTTLKGNDALDEAVKACSSYTSIQNLIDSFVGDCRSINDADTFLRDKCGIILDNQDSGAITGWDMGGSTVKTNASIVPEEGALKSFSGNSFVVNGLTVKLAKDYSELSDKEKAIWHGLYTWWIKNSLDLIAESYGNNFSFNSNGSATVKTLTIEFVNNDNSTLASTTATQNDSTSISITLNMKYWSGLDESDVNGYSTVPGAGYFDTTFVHEMVHLLMRANIANSSWLPMYIHDGMAELTRGIDIYRRPTIEQLAGDASTLGKVFDTTGYATIEGVDSPTYAGGYMLLRYLAKQSALASGTTYNGTSGSDRLSVTNMKVLVDADADNDTVNVAGSNVTIDGGAGDDVISLSGGGNVIRIGIGRGNDTVINYSDTDSLQLPYSSTLYNTVKSGDDLVFSAYDNSILLKGGADKTINFADKYPFADIENSSANTVVNGTGGDEIINSWYGTGVTIRAGAGNDTLVSGWRSSLSALDGGAGDDLIFIQSGYETVDGGEGNDTIYADHSWSKSGRVYLINSRGGSDTVIGYSSNDTVRIADGSFLSTAASGDDVIVSLESARMTLKDAVSKQLNLAIEGCNPIANANANTLIVGSNGKDQINLTGNKSGVTIRAGGGDDLIFGDTVGHMYQFGIDDGNDTIYNLNENDTIQFHNGAVYGSSTVGNDVVLKLYNDETITLKDAKNKTLILKGGYLPTGAITNGYGGSTVKGTSGKDFINSWAERATITAGDGDDTIYSGIRASLSAIDAGAGNDRIFVTSGYETVDGGGGDDTIYAAGSMLNKGRVYVIDSRGGSDIVIGYNSNDSVRIADGSFRSTVASGDDVIVSLESARMTLKDAASKQLNLAIEGYNPIANSNANTLVVGSNGKDQINLTGNKSGVTIRAGGGDDLIFGDTVGHIYQFGIGDGNDTIYNLNENDTIQLHNETRYNSSTVGNDVVLKLYDDETITLKDAKGKPLILRSGYLPAGAITNGSDGSTVKGTSGKDFINSWAERATITAGDGDDTVYNGWTASLSAIDGGAGNDRIFVTSGYETVDGGGGDDTIYAAGSMLNKGRVYVIDSRGGSDVVIGYNSNDIVRIADGSIYQTLTSGNDVIVSLPSARMTLKDAAKQTLNIDVVGSGINTISNSASNVKVPGTSEAEYIVNSGAKVTIQGNEGADTIVGSDNGEMILVASNHGNDLIQFFGADDTLRCTAGSINATAKSGSDVIVTLKGAAYSSVVTLGGAANYNLAKSGQNIYAVDPGGSFNVIDNRTRNTLVSGSGERDSIYNYAKNVTINAGAGDDTVQTFGNSVKVEGGAGNDSIKTTGGTGVTLHGGAGNDTLTGSSSAEIFQFRSDGDADVITNFESNDTLHIAAGKLNSYYVDGNDLVVIAKGTSYTGYVTLQGAGANAVKVKVGNGAVETINNALNPISNTTRNTVVTGTSGDDSINNYAKNVTVNAGDGNDLVTTYGNSVSVFGGNGDDSIRTTGGTGVTLHGGAGNDTLTGSSSAEIFQFRSDGNSDVITNFESNDTLHIAAGKLNSYYVDGNDLVVIAKGTSYTGYVTLQGAGANAVKVKVGNGAVETINSVLNPISNTTRNTIVTGTSGADSINNYAKNVTVNAGDGNDLVTTYGNSVSVFGGNGNDSLRSTGGSGVTLHGGAGNDTLTGSSNAEIFQFRSDGGNDVVTNFALNDKLKITAGSVKNYYESGADYIVEVKGAQYSGAITLKGAAALGTLEQSGTTLTLNASSKQLPAEDYWFESSSIEQSPLNEIVSTEAALDLETDFGTNRLNRSMKKLMLGSARRHQK